MNPVAARGGWDFWRLSQARTNLCGTILVVAVIQLALCEIGLLFELPIRHVSMFWPAAGMAIVFVFRLGTPAGVGVFLGSFSANLLSSIDSLGGWGMEGLLLSAGIATGSTISAFLGAAILRRYATMEGRLDVYQMAVGVLGVTGVIACIPAAIIGSLALVEAGVVAQDEFVVSVGTWYLGDLSGAVFGVPLGLTLLRGKDFPWIRYRRGSVLAILIVCGLYTVFCFGDEWVRRRLESHGLANRFELFSNALGARLDAAGERVLRGGEVSPHMDPSNQGRGLIADRREPLRKAGDSGILREVRTATLAMMEEGQLAVGMPTLLVPRSGAWQDDRLMMVAVHPTAETGDASDDMTFSWEPLDLSDLFRLLGGNNDAQCKRFWNYCRLEVLCRGDDSQATPLIFKGVTDAKTSKVLKRFSGAQHIGGSEYQTVLWAMPQGILSRLDLTVLVPPTLALGFGAVFVVLRVGQSGRFWQIESLVGRRDSQLQKERSEGERRRRLFVALANASRDGVLIVGRDQYVLNVNDTLLDLMRCAKYGVIGIKIGELLGVEADEMRAAADEGLSLSVVRRDGTTFPARVYCYASEEGLGSDMIWILQDISLNESMRERLDRADRAVEEVNQMKVEFMANMSHELRTPLNGVMGMLSSVLDDPLPNATKQNLEIAYDSARSLLGMVEDLLDLSALDCDSVSLQMEPIDLTQFLLERIEVYRRMAIDKGVAFDLAFGKDLPKSVSGDSKRVWQVVSQLLHNAVKFTNQGSVSIGVRTSAQEVSKCWIEFEIVDTGVGFPMEKKDELLSNLTQGDSGLSKRFGGVGVGLSIAKQLTDLMGGQLCIRPRESGGTVVLLTVPFELFDPNTDQIVRSLSGGTVVVVAHNGPFRERLVESLRMVRVEPVVAGSGSEALDRIYSMALRRKPIALVILEQLLVDGRGSHYFERIREVPGCKQTPGILVTGPDSELTHEESELFCLTRERERLLARFSEDLLSLLQGGRTFAECDSGLDEARMKGVRVVMIDDDLGSTRLVHEILGRAGASFKACSSLRLAQEEADLASFDVVILACNLPLVDPNSAVQSLRDSGFSGPILAVVEAEYEASISKCNAAGMNDWISKPICRDSLFSAILGQYDPEVSV